MIFDCARTKLEIVAADERDTGHREVLNLGHTVGHGIEAATGYRRYRHGEAVGLGLLAALRLSGAGELREEVAGSSPPRVAHQRSPQRSTLGGPRGGRARQEANGEGVGFVLLERPGEPRVGQRVDDDRVRAAVEELR